MTTARSERASTGTLRAWRFTSLALGASWLLAPNASAQDCFALRPTDADADWSYDTDAIQSYNSPPGNLKIWFATEGRHAPELDGTEVPDAVRLASEIAEDALTRYAELGFLPPASDANYPSCASNGGDGRLDLYLFDFQNADGTIMTEECGASDAAPCSGFMIVENDFDGLGYASTEEAFRTIIPHELFHLVQSAYSSKLDPWWNEGTAQWATKKLYPALDDLESYLPAFFSEAGRPLDFPPPGAAQPYNYGSAIWPVFLDERYGADSVRQVFEAASEGALPTTTALELALTARGASLGDAYVTFAQWNVATGSLAGDLGYTNADTYPRAPTEAFPDETPASVRDVSAGLSTRYFVVERADPSYLELEATHQRAFLLPVVDGEARLGDARELPTEFFGLGVVLVAGTSVSKQDAPFTLKLVAPEDATPTPGGAGGGGPGATMGRPDEAGGAAGASGSEAPGLGEDSSCEISAQNGRRRHEPELWVAALMLLGCLARRGATWHGNER